MSKKDHTYNLTVKDYKNVTGYFNELFKNITHQEFEDNDIWLESLSRFENALRQLADKIKDRLSTIIPPEKILELERGHPDICLVEGDTIFTYAGSTKIYGICSYILIQNLLLWLDQSIKQPHAREMISRELRTESHVTDTLNKIVSYVKELLSAYDNHSRFRGGKSISKQRSEKGKPIFEAIDILLKDTKDPVLPNPRSIWLRIRKSGKVGNVTYKEDVLDSRPYTNGYLIIELGNDTDHGIEEFQIKFEAFRKYFSDYKKIQN